MDADFSHDPADLARLLAAVRAAAPTSRSARATSPGGGGRRLGLPAARRQPRRVAGTRARVLGPATIRDLTGGFKCFRARGAEAIDLASVRSQGYAFQVELTYRAVRAGFRVRRGPDRLPRPPRGPSQDVVADRRSRRCGSSRDCAARRRSASGRRASSCAARAEAMVMQPVAIASSSTACDDTRATLRAGTRAPLARRRRAGSLGAARSPSACCSPSGPSRTSRRPTARASCCPASRAGDLARRRRACCSATRSCSRCTRWPASPASSPAARCRCRPSATAALAPRPRQGRPARDRASWSARRRSRSARRPTCSAATPRRSPRSCGIVARRCCCSACCPHAIPELVALFLPLAAWIIASRRGEWEQLLAATLRHRRDRGPGARRSRRSSRSTSGRTCCASRCAGVALARRRRDDHFTLYSGW